MNTKPKSNMPAGYFGLNVEVISRMDSCSLILFQGRQFVVDTADLLGSATCNDSGHASELLACNRERVDTQFSSRALAQAC
jgi:hypothetical protein